VLVRRRSKRETEHKSAWTREKDLQGSNVAFVARNAESWKDKTSASKANHDHGAVVIRRIALGQKKESSVRWGKGKNRRRGEGLPVEGGRDQTGLYFSGAREQRRGGAKTGHLK